MTFCGSCGFILKPASKGESLKTEKGIVTVYTLWIYCRAHIHGYYPHITLEEAMKHINGVLAWGNKDFHVELVPAKN